MARLLSMFVIGVAAQTRAEQLEQVLALGRRNAPAAYGAFGGAAELLEQLLRLVFDVAQHIGDAVSAHFADKIETSVLVDAYADHIGVTHEVVQLSLIHI